MSFFFLLASLRTMKVRVPTSLFTDNVGGIHHITSDACWINEWMNEYEWQIKTVGRMMEATPSKDQDKGKYWLGVIYSVDSRGWLRKMGEVRHFECNLKCYVVISRKLRVSKFSFNEARVPFELGDAHTFGSCMKAVFFFFSISDVVSGEESIDADT